MSNFTIHMVMEYYQAKKELNDDDWAVLAALLEIMLVNHLHEDVQIHSERSIAFSFMLFEQFEKDYSFFNKLTVALAGVRLNRLDEYKKHIHELTRKLIKSKEFQAFK